MLLERRLEMNFERSHVQEPLICEMARRCAGVMFNIDSLSVGSLEASMTITLVGEPPDLRCAEEYFSSFNVNIRTVAEEKYKKEIPTVPTRTAISGGGGQTVERKLWLTVLGSLRRQAFLWVLARRFDVTYKLMQSVTGDPVSIVSMLIWGAENEVDGAVSFLREQGVNVEHGEVAVSAPFSP